MTFLAAPALAQNEIEELREQLRALSEIVEHQALEIEALKAERKIGTGPVAKLSPAEGNQSALIQSIEPRDQETALRALPGLPRLRGRFPDDAVVRPGDFEGAISIPGTDASVKIGGLIRVEGNYDLDSLGFQDAINSRRIPLDGTPEDGANQSRFHVRNSRLNVDYRRQSSLGDIRAFVEFDFFGGGAEFINNYELRLRHAVAQIGNIYVGQWWSQFTDISATPEGVDFGPPLGQPVLRNPGIRWAHSLGQEGKWRLGFGLENPAGDLSDPNDLFASDSVPNITSYIELTRDWGRIRLAGLGLQLDSVNDTAFTGGINVSGRLNTRWPSDNDNLAFGFTAGEGFTHYYSTFAGAGLEGVIDENGDITPTGIYGGYIGYQHWWGDKWRSTIHASFLNLDAPAGSSPDSFESGQRISANLFWSPIDDLSFGVEYNYATQTTFDQQDGSGSRLGAVAQIDF